MEGRIYISVLLIIISSGIFAQEKHQNDSTLESRIKKIETKFGKFLNNIKISGYIQAQWRLSEVTGLESINSAGRASGGTFPANGNNAFNISRGRLRVAYSDSIISAIVQVNFTEKEIKPGNINFGVSDPWIKWFTLRAGIQTRPFGYEVNRKAPILESPERARMITTLFAGGNRDIGVKLVAAAPQNSPLAGFLVEGGAFVGNGTSFENDGKMDFIGRVRYDNSKFAYFDYGLGISAYVGQVYQLNNSLYAIRNGFFEEIQSNNSGKYAMRNYLGGDLQTTIKWEANTTIRFETIGGVQPSQHYSMRSPRADNHSSVYSYNYLRNFIGASAILIQSIPKVPVKITLKYDYFDPNTNITGAQIGVYTSEIEQFSTRTTNLNDIAYHTLGAGISYEPLKNLKLMIYYEFVDNERAPNLDIIRDEQILSEQFNQNVKDNILTVRLQASF